MIVGMGRLRAALVVLAVLGVGLVAGCTSTDDPGSGGPRASDASPAPSATATESTTPATGSAEAALARIPVKGRAAKTGYDRDQYGPAWTDDTDVPFGHNGCDTRNDVLRRDLYDPVIKKGTFGCVALSGELRDPYTATVIHFVRASASAAVQIDHVVALGDSWQSGAQRWSPEKRQDFASDPLNLVAVDGPANESKGDSNAASWLPANHAFRCAYVARQTEVKAAYGLWMTAAEKDAIARVLARCPHQPVPREPGRLHPPSRPSVAAATPPLPAATGPGTKQPAGEGCAPGYRPCLPIVDDLDCGDLTSSQKPVHVTGDDPYRLDADGDGLGCTS
jgi:hypothetical protein